MIHTGAKDSVKDPAAVTLGRLGGAMKSDAKTAAARVNGRLGGRRRNQKGTSSSSVLAAGFGAAGERGSGGGAASASGSTPARSLDGEPDP